MGQIAIQAKYVIDDYCQGMFKLVQGFHMKRSLLKFLTNDDDS